MDDETLLALKADGGVVQVVAYDSYLKPQPEEKAAAVRALRQERRPHGQARGRARLRRSNGRRYAAGLREIETRWPAATVADLVDHIDYAVELIGIDHVGISSDFDGGGGVTGWADAAETANVTAELEARGYSQEDIGKLWSGNLLRVWREAERTAAELAAAARLKPTSLRAASPRHAPNAGLAQGVCDLARALQLRRLVRVVRLLERYAGLAQHHAERDRKLRLRHRQQQLRERAVRLVVNEHVARIGLRVDDFQRHRLRVERRAPSSRLRRTPAVAHARRAAARRRPCRAP